MIAAVPTNFCKERTRMRKLFLSLCLLLPFTASAQTNLPDFTDIVEKQGAAVVNVSTTQVIRSRSILPQFPNLDEDDPMFEFFKRFIPRQPGGPRDRQFQNRSLGSGFVISSDGYLLTNAHVVEAADEITVTLTDKREFRAKVIGSDKRTDVALIKIEASGLPKVTMGDPSRVRVGEWVVAIGSPFGFENSVTAGIVSAKGRSLPQESFVPFIQTDVAINPGNSGGPLFNMRGEVIGINSQIYSRSGGYMGLSFAIPIDVAMDVQHQLRSGGRVSRGRIGVLIQEVTKELAESFGMPKPTGALVNSTETGGPADKAGIESTDIILKFDGKSVNSSGDLPRIVGGTRPGAKVAVQVWRKGAMREFTVTVAEIPEEKVAKNEPRGKAPEAKSNRLGLVLSELDAKQREELKLASGLLVDEVRNEARADFRRGDILLAMIVKGVNAELKTVEQFNKVLAQTDKSSNITFLVRRGEQQVFVTVRGGDK
jgi:serine protease Do